MIDFIVIGVILVFVLASVAYMYKSKKSGKSSCGCNCENCKSTCGALKINKDSNNK